MRGRFDNKAPLRERARSRWTGILPALGIDSRYLTGKHTACPICREGKDRFRFDNKDGAGTWICSVCGAGDGVQLVMELNGWDFATAAKEIEAHLGDALVEPIRKGLSAADQKEARRAVYRASRAISAGDPVAKFLGARVGLSTFPSCLRTVPRLRYHDDPPSWHPAMIALVADRSGAVVNFHRTYLSPEGCKAAVKEPRRLMLGDVPKGSAVRLAEPGDVLGIAEGVETAFAATALFNVPCWAALNTSLLMGWVPPEHVREVIIFGDHDWNFAGHAAAYTLAHRIIRETVTVEVRIPDAVGDDWNDVLFRQQRQAA